MRIDSPKGIKSWLHGFFSGSFKGTLYGTAETASYVHSSSVDGLEEMFKNLDDTISQNYFPITGGLIRGDVTIGATCDEEGKPVRSSNLVVHGSIRTGGGVHVDGGFVKIKGSKLVYDSDLEELQVRFDKEND